MDFLKAEISRKRKQVEELTVNKDKKFFVRKELYEKDDENAGKGDDETTNEEEKKDLSLEEIYERLRVIKEPIRYFGENDEDIKNRYKIFESQIPNIDELVKMKNEMDKKSHKVLVNDDNISNEDNVLDEKKYDVIYSDGQDIKWDDIEESAQSLGEDDSKDCKTISNFIKYALQVWADELNEREIEKKKSIEGKFQTSLHNETVHHIKPLLKDLDNERIKNDIRCHLSVICRYIIVEKDLIKSNNAYMEMAIGNAPWPVGVTRSGIHQRPSSSRMYVSNIAHVLNDERQRKYIQGFKRLLTRQFENVYKKC
uniref:Pre-mRNA-splicing factor 18 n=1 Tax=Parastrongyloides trichosuri TaxID=131310 RepID=A0A0N4Z454_PARTI